MYVKLGNECVDTREFSKQRWHAFETLKKIVIKGETYSADEYPENGQVNYVLIFCYLSFVRQFFAYLWPLLFTYTISVRLLLTNESGIAASLDAWINYGKSFTNHQIISENSYYYAFILLVVIK